MRLFRCAAIAGVVMLATGCRERGELQRVEADPSFVTERSELYVTSGSIRRVALDGTGLRTVFDGLYAVVTTSPDRATFLLGNSDTERFLGDVTTGTVRRIDEIGNRGWIGAFSPDGARVAIARHADFSLPQSEWVDDDTIYVVDVETGTTTVLPPTSNQQPYSLHWSQDAAGIWQPGPGLPPFAAPSPCSGTVVAERRGTTIDLIDAAGTKVVVVEELGRKRGFHDYRDDFHDVTFSPDCGYIVFGFENAVWVAEARERGRVARIAEGHFLFFAPR